MKNNLIILIGCTFFKKAFFAKGLLILLSLFLLVLSYIIQNNWSAYKTRHVSVVHHQEASRNSWDSNPDKHPHRMAHFGSFVFRPQHPLSIFDSGIENYTGNSIFLEAHQQNTANFSEAALSTGLLRFGDLNIALLLQLILPLIMFFIGYAAITAEKESGTLKIIYLQGVSIQKILLGKALGLFMVSALFFTPALIALWSITSINTHHMHAEVALRCIVISISYILFFSILSIITVIASAKSTNSNSALLSLLGYWLLFFIIMPKTAQILGNYLYPNASKIEFREVIETELAKRGDSHNPNDAHFNALRDSILNANNVTNVEELPFNYSGFLMSKGEEQTAIIYANQYNKLINTYQKQNSITNNLVFLNPYLAVKNLSMGLSGSDFYSYTNFLSQTETYRYKQSQYINDLQIKFISNKAKGSEGKVHVVNKSHWKAAPKFNYKYISVKETIKQQVIPLIVLLIWSLLAILFVTRYSSQFKIL